MEAFSQQAKIGWHGMMEGKLGGYWAATQQAWYEHIGRRNPGMRWATALVLKLLDIAWDQWDHHISIANAL